MGRLQFDSGEMTQVASPNPMLLAVARGEMLQSPRRLRWFAAGMVVGATAVWFATSDVRGDIFAARVHAASVLRSLRGQVNGDDAPSAMTTGATRAAGANASGAANVPPIDVSQLRAEETPASPSPSSGPQASPPAVAAPPGAPALAHAPGPR